jgi:glycosyltransferase involved in cell wall biosynthesis
LPALYSLAAAFVHPEHYDGFSLQLLEAMACGAPTVISDAPALTEIVQGDALIAGTDAASFEARLERLFREPGLASELRRRSLSRAAQYTWRKTAEQTVAIYEELAASRSARPRE